MSASLTDNDLSKRIKDVKRERIKIHDDASDIINRWECDMTNKRSDVQTFWEHCYYL